MAVCDDDKTWYFMAPILNVIYAENEDKVNVANLLKWCVDMNMVI